MIHSICSVVAVFKMLIRILNTLRSRIWDVLFFSGYSKSTVGENGDSPKVYTFYSDGNFQKKCVNPLGFNFPRIYNLLENFSLVNSHNLLANPLLFPTEITNLLFVIKTNSRWNKILCWIAKNYDKEKRIVISIAFCDFALNAYFPSKENSRGYNRRNRTPYINVSFLEFNLLEIHIFLGHPHSHQLWI